MTVLGQLFGGKLYPFQDLKVRNDGEYDMLGAKIEEEIKYVKSLLNSKDGERLDRLWDLEQQYDACELRESFICGFKLAMRMMVEVFGDASSEITHGG